MKRSTLKIVLTLVAGIILLVIYLYNNNRNKVETSGSIQIIVVDDKGIEVVNETVKFDIVNSEGKKTTLKTILEENYEIKTKNGMLVGIEGVNADTTEYFLKIYVNCISALQGIEQLSFKDKDVIMFVYTKVGDFDAPC